MRLTAGEYSTAAHNVVCMGAIGWKGDIKPVRKVGKCPLQESKWRYIYLVFKGLYIFCFHFYTRLYTHPFFIRGSHSRFYSFLML